MSIKFDFSEFHPLDHWPWERRCWSSQVQPGYTLPFKGGPWHHLTLAWAMRWRGRLADALWWRPVQRFRCPRGRHRATASHTSRDGFIMECWYCEYSRPMAEGEEPEFREMIAAFERAFPPQETP